jgi:phosphohistidine phosphatase
MQLLIIRHAIAVDRDPANLPDAERALTDKGRRRMKQCAAGLLQLVPSLDVIASSKLLRARETAGIVAQRYRLDPIFIDQLAPEAPLGRLLEWLAVERASTVALVGHEPGLSTFASWLISARPESHLVLKKGGACLLEFPGKIEPGAAMLEWLLTPGQLRTVS